MTPHAFDEDIEDDGIEILFDPSDKKKKPVKKNEQARDATPDIPVDKPMGNPGSAAGDDSGRDADGQ